ncbi:Exosome complex component rrp45 [Zancudomyces culisetae]|uniref:Exosome complex component rrp45 n=1 Tax=Zancudomyces culisetae TaxID=1213189 RepID=A0A1R1PYG9_ZANCU|nr:Exosome complex component rrp45 [Zancudomyces culisetae]|eukprot:OMH86012.1 Exosome complex component rrp45 [Zancudomyces culisetae]
MRVTINNDKTNAEINRVQSVVSCEAVRPYPDRPTEGILTINSEINSMASLEFETNRPSEQEVMISRMLEKIIRVSRAVDTESLCIDAGEQVWNVRVDVHFLSYDGNLVDAAVIAVMTSLRHFRRPDVTKEGTEVTIHDIKERVPVPLSIHHTPISITFGHFGDEKMVVDSTLLEEKFQQGSLTIAINTNKEICCVSKAGGESITDECIIMCSMIAVEKSTEICEKIDAALKSSP